MIGKVLFYLENGAKQFGFIEDEAAPGNREANVWFGPRALNGLTVKAGDRVVYELSPIFKKDKGPQAARVWLRDDNREEITTLQGIDDV
jgi:cold shock CspA family protein